MLLTSESGHPYSVTKVDKNREPRVISGVDVDGTAGPSANKLNLCTIHPRLTVGVKTDCMIVI